MPESMTCGDGQTVLHGGTVRHDRPGMTVSGPLPSGTLEGDPIVIKHEQFAGLQQMGITHLAQGQHRITVETKTGLRANIPFMVDPYRTIELRIAADATAIHPPNFIEWADTVVMVARAMGTPTAMTYRSSVFAHSRSVMIVARLETGWPAPCVIAADEVRSMRAKVGPCVPDKVRISTNQIFVQSASMKALMDTPDLPIGQAAVDLIAALKPHTLPVITEVNSSALADAIQQIAVAESASSAPRHDKENTAVELSIGPNGLKLKTRVASVVLPTKEGVTLEPLVVPMSTLRVLAHIADWGDTAQIVKWALDSQKEKIIFRCGRCSFIFAARK